MQYLIVITKQESLWLVFGHLISSPIRRDGILVRLGKTKWTEWICQPDFRAMRYWDTVRYWCSRLWDASSISKNTALLSNGIGKTDSYIYRALLQNQRYGNLDSL